MALLKTLVLAFAFVDILAPWRIAGVSASGLEWLFLGYCALAFLILQGGVVRLVVRNKWFALVALFGAINAFRAADYASAAVDVIYVSIPLLFWGVAYRLADTVERILTVLSTMLVSVWIPFLTLALALAFGAVEYVEGVGPRSAIGPRSAALMVQPIAAVALSVLVLGKQVASGNLRRGAFFALLIAATVMFGTLSRTSILCLVVFALAMAWLAPRAKGVFIALLAAGLAVGTVLNVPELRERIVPEEAMSVEEVLESGAYTSGRALIWSSLLEQSLDAPWLGHGTGNSKPFVAERFPDSASIPHNEYLRNFFDGGFAALALVTLAWLSRVWQYYCLTKVAVRCKEQVGAVLYASAFLCALGTAMAGFFDNVFLYVFMTGNVFIVFGIADRHRDLIRQQRDQRWALRSTTICSSSRSAGRRVWGAASPRPSRGVTMWDTAATTS
jgi:hypothetical protein